MRSEVLEVGIEPSGLARVKQRLSSYILLTKPRIIMLFGLTGLTAMVMEGSLLHNQLALWMVLAGIVMVGGSANALNQYYDRDIDAVMERTKKKRPLPQGVLSPSEALVFALFIGVLGTALLFYFGNFLASLLGVGTIVYYVGFYTLWLKRRTPYNIVIGGAAGATAPLIGWAAATGEIAWTPFILFLIVFMWTPPHFWALALCVKDEYAKVSVPMLPVVAGERKTRNQILGYTILLVPLTLSLMFTGDVGKFYLISASLLGLEFLRRAIVLFVKKTKDKAWKLFGYSILYLMVLFLFLIVDAFAAEKTPTELLNVGFKEHLGQKIDLDLPFTNEQGKEVTLRSVMDGTHPIAIFLVYYGCPNLCGLFMNGAIASLKKLDWTPGKEFQIVTISIDPTEEYELAAQKKENTIAEYGRDEAKKGWHFWVTAGLTEAQKNENDPTVESNVKKLANQVGFGYKYDKDQGQFAHAAGMILLTPEGRISRYLYGIDFKPKDLKLALVEASGSKIGTIMDRILLFCYNYDPKTKKYSLYAMNLMRAGGALTTAFLLAMGMVYWRRKD